VCAIGGRWGEFWPPARRWKRRSWNGRSAVSPPGASCEYGRQRGAAPVLHAPCR